jgi:hypothetical protein
MFVKNFVTVLICIIIIVWRLLVAIEELRGPEVICKDRNVEMCSQLSDWKSGDLLISCNLSLNSMALCHGHTMLVLQVNKQAVVIHLDSREKATVLEPLLYVITRAKKRGHTIFRIPISDHIILNESLVMQAARHMNKFDKMVFTRYGTLLLTTMFPGIPSFNSLKSNSYYCSEFIFILLIASGAIPDRAISIFGKGDIYPMKILQMSKELGEWFEFNAIENVVYNASMFL